MHTEDEARTKWCPMARVAFQYREGAPDAMIVANRAENDHPIGCCIASDCMGWLWDDDESGDPAYRRVATGGGHYMSEPLGHCGLAGKE